MIFIMAILAVVVFTSGCTQGQNNQTQPNTTVNNNTTAIEAIDIAAVQKGPETAKKGMNVTIQYEVSNKGSENVTDVRIVSQGVEQILGALKPGETKRYTSQLYIPTDAEVQQDFGPNATVSNPFFIGGFSVIFNSTKSVTSNSIQIKLV
jgi:hypothetical protein